jgi:hypothetical protein
MGSLANAESPGLPWHKRIAPALALMVLAPVVAEVLSGATRVSFLVVLISEIMVWGCGALLIREMCTAGAAAGRESFCLAWPWRLPKSSSFNRPLSPRFRGSPARPTAAPSA